MDYTNASASILRSAIAFLILSLFAHHLWAAEPVMFSTTRTTATIVNNGASAALPLNNAGTTLLLPFGGSKYLIQFHAECSVKADDDNTSLTIAIVVDPGEADQQIVAPTGLATFELCTSIKPNPGVAAAHHRQSVGTSVLVNVAGHEYHEIQVLRQINGFNAGEEALIDELSLVVIAQ
jgi:hypothetical protein